VLQKTKWFRLKSPYSIEKQGKQVRRVAGDWIKTGWQEGQMLVAKGIAEIPGQNAIEAFVGGDEDTGMLVLGSQAAAGLVLANFGGKLSVEYGDAWSMPWKRTIIWNPLAQLRQGLIPAGLGLLDAWQIAMPLWDNYSLATQEGTPEDREQTAEIIRDLRVPLYDTRLIFVKRCDETEQLFMTWRAELRKGESDRLAFLRAFYQTKPFMLALPITWTGQHVDDDR